MQTLSSALQTELNKGQLDPRILVDLIELYDSDYIPGASGFDPADAIEAFAAETITWNGQAYRREMVSRGDVTRNMNEKTNQVTLTFSNISRYMATLATTQQIEGLFLVIRTVVPSVTDDSIVLFVGRCDKPSDIDKQQFTLNARQDFGNINQEIPPREFTAEDPSGRTPSDSLFEGFRFTSLSGTHQVPVLVPSTSFFGRLFGRQRLEYKTQQWSSLDGTPYGSILPLIFGRCQMEAIAIFFADIGWALIGVWVLGEGRVDDITNVAVRDSRFSLTTTEPHMGDPGGTGTNNTTLSGPINHGYLSKTAYVVLSMSGTTVEVVDDAPLITALVRGVRVPVPNASGVYASSAWSDNPVNIARFVLTDPRLVRINEGFMEDSVNYQTGLHCDEALIDDSNGEVTLLAQADQPQGGTGITRVRGTGILDARYFRYNHLGDTSVIPEFEDPTYTPFDPSDIPTTFAITRLLRKRYTCNVPLTEKMRAVDFLYKVIFPAAKLFLRINKRGKYEIRTEKPSDATMIRSATAVNATAIPVLDVVPWKTGDLLQGRIQLGFGLTTSEVRTPTSADYSADGNAITLTTGVTGGGVTSVASGATLTGGSATVQASGTITVGGTPAAGNTITATINGIGITYTLTADDTTGTTAAMLSSHINATPKLRRFIKSTWASGTPTVITITALLGVLNVPALLKAHTAPIADPTASSVLAASAGTLAAGTYKVAYSDITALGKSALSPTSSIVLTANQKIDVGALALVGTSRNWYMSDAANSEYLKFVANTNGAAFSLTALPLPGAALPPQYNATGEEVIRIAMSFATNSQDVYSVWPASTLVVLSDIYLPTTPNGHKYQVTTAGTTSGTEPTWPLTAGGTVVDGGVTWTEIGATVLGQAGLTRANIKKDTFHYPLGSRQSSVNQVKISYRDANNDFARTPYRVSDPVHQALVNKPLPMEVNGEAIDNFSQMYRIANWQLAKNREGDWFYTFGTGPQGLVLEEGDVICASDDSGGLVNQVCRIEELRIHPNHDVTIGQARKYSTNMFSDDVTADVISVPTTLRYVQTVDSLVEFIDNFAIRDADALVPGFYVVVSRDLNIEGDWRGSVLYADYGDGYVQIAESDIPAVVGTATTILGTVADPEVFDTANTFTADAATDVITQTGNVLANGNSVLVSNSGGALPAPLVAGTVYFVRDKSGNTLKLAATSGGAAIDLTTNGTGTNSIKNALMLTLKYGEPAPAPQPFSTTTQVELQANPRRNLFLYGDEYLQAATVVFNGSQSYTLSDFYRGRLDTNSPLHLTHGAGERVVYLNGAEMFVPVDQTRLNLPFNYKAVTTNQDVSDATAVSFTWTGGTIKPPAPDQITVYRDRLVADATRAQQIQFIIPTPVYTFGDTLPPVKDRSPKFWVDVYGATATANFTADAATDILTSAAHGFTADTVIALSTTGVLPALLKKEKHYFIRDITTNTFRLAAVSGGPAIDITTAGTGTHSFSIRKRKMSARAGMFNPAVLVLGSGSVTPGAGGWLQTIQSSYTARNTADAAISLTSAVLGDITETGYELEFTLAIPPSGAGESQIEFESLSPTLRHTVHFTNLISGAGLPSKYVAARRWLLRIKETVGGSETTKFTETEYEMPDTRYRMQISGSEVRIYRNHSGPGSELVYRSTLPPKYPATVQILLDSDVRFSNIMIGGKPESITTYPDSDQILDFGAQPQTFRFRVYEERVVQGYSYLSDVTDFIT